MQCHQRVRLAKKGRLSWIHCSSRAAGGNVSRAAASTTSFSDNGAAVDPGKQKKNPYQNSPFRALSVVGESLLDCRLCVALSPNK